MADIENKQFKDIELTKEEKKFLQRLRRVQGNLSFHITSFKPEIPDCKEKRWSLGGYWSVGFGYLSEPIDGDYGKAVLTYLLGDELESERAFRAIQEADTKMIKEQHQKEGHEQKTKGVSDKNSKEGYIYLIENDGYFKIGRTQNPKERTTTYKTENPKPIEVILCRKVNHYREIEEKLLEKFNEKKFRGEWFELNEDDIDFIKNYLSQQEL